MPVAIQLGGAELMLLHLGEHARAAGARLHVVFLEDGPLVAQIRATGAATTIISSGRMRHVHQHPRTIIRLTRALRQQRAEVALAWMRKSQLYAGPAAMCAHIPSLLYHLEPHSKRDWLDVAARHAAARGIVTVSDHMAVQMLRQFPKLPLRVVRPGVDLTRFDPARLPDITETRRGLGLPEAGPLVGSVARLQRWKGIHVLIEAMPAILARYPTARCVIVGAPDPTEPQYPGYLRDLTHRLGLNDVVLFCGFQTNVPLWRHALDVNVQASDQEPFSLGVLESMAAARPVVAGDSGGSPEVVVPDQTGLLVPFGDAPALSTAILRLVDDPAAARRMGLAGREAVRSLSTEQFAVKLVRAVDELRLAAIR